jgi:hypothetical protein
MGKRPEGRADKLLEFCVSDAFNDARIVSAEEFVGSFHGTLISSVLVVAAENIPGVKAVCDQLVWFDAASGMVIYQSNEEPVPAKAS